MEKLGAILAPAVLTVFGQHSVSEHVLLSGQGGRAQRTGKRLDQNINTWCDLTRQNKFSGHLHRSCNGTPV
jgi:hypothetical protein